LTGYKLIKVFIIEETLEGGIMKFTGLLMMIAIIVFLAVGAAYSDDAKKGKALFNDSRLGTNGKSCNTCHPGGSNIDGSKRTFNILGEQISSISGAVNFCIENALEGKPLAADSQDMKDIVSYISALKGGKIQEKSIAPGY
jgi:cytochrome c553